MTPRDLLFAHRYSEAADGFQAALRRNSKDASALVGHARAMLCLGRFQEALEEFRRANERGSVEVPGSQPELLRVGALEWLLGSRRNAIATFEQAVAGIQDGSIEYADNAGGALQGLLLWYAAVSEGDEPARLRAIRYMEWLAKRPRIAQWPGPIALFALGRIARQDLLRTARGGTPQETSGSAPTPEDALPSDLLGRRRWVSALFYCATQHRARGAERECASDMRACAAVPNPILEIEWYLARAETSGT